MNAKTAPSMAPTPSRPPSGSRARRRAPILCPSMKHPSMPRNRSGVIHGASDASMSEPPATARSLCATAVPRTRAATESGAGPSHRTLPIGPGPVTMGGMIAVAVPLPGTRGPAARRSPR